MLHHSRHLCTPTATPPLPPALSLPPSAPRSTPWSRATWPRALPAPPGPSSGPRRPRVQDLRYAVTPHTATAVASPACNSVGGDAGDGDWHTRCYTRLAGSSASLSPLYCPSSQPTTPHKKPRRGAIARSRWLQRPSALPTPRPPRPPFWSNPFGRPPLPRPASARKRAPVPPAPRRHHGPRPGLPPPRRYRKDATQQHPRGNNARPLR